MNDKKAFTLTELIVTILILSLVLLLIIPVVNNSSEGAKESLKNSKITTLEVSGEKYGNDNINNYKSCNGDYASLSSECTVEISKLIQEGYIEGENDTAELLDPTTNTSFSGKILICYDPSKLNVYTKYVEDGVYSCEDIDITGHSLNLNKTVMQGYIGGTVQEVNIITHGDFDRGISAITSNSSLVTASITGNKLQLRFATSEPFGGLTDENNKVTITVTGKYNGDAGVASLTKKIEITMYKTSIAIENHPHTSICLKTESSINYNVLGNNLGILSYNITSNSNPNPNISAIIDKQTLYITAGTQTGDNSIIVQESNGLQSTNGIDISVYKLYSKTNLDLLSEVIVNKKNVFELQYGNTGDITLKFEPEGIAKFIDNGQEKSELILRDSEILVNPEISFVAKNMGEGVLKITGSECGYLEHKFVSSNLTLSSHEEVLYVGGTSASVNISSDNKELSCKSSDESIATCLIDGTILKVNPNTNGNEGTVTITVMNKLGAQSSLSAQVYKPTINAYDMQGNNLNKLCFEKEGANEFVEFKATGENMGAVSTDGVDNTDNWHVADVTVNGNTIKVGKRNLTAEQEYGPYKAGYNNGTVPFYLVESNGNQRSDLITMYVYSLIGEVPRTIEVGEKKTFTYRAIDAGNLHVSSSNTNVVEVSVKRTNNNNEYSVTLLGKSTGSATISFSGSECGSKTYTVSVNGNELKLYLKPGKNSKHFETKTLSCTTTGSNNYCSVTLPSFESVDGYEAAGYSVYSDKLEGTLKSGSEVTLYKNMNHDTLYAVSKDISNPICSFENVSTSMSINKEAAIKLNCIDKESNIKEAYKLVVDNFTISNNNVAEISNISSPQKNNLGYSYTIKIKAKSMGNFNIQFNNDIIFNGDGLSNAGVISNDIFVSEYSYKELWYIGETKRTDVYAILYSNKEISDTTSGYTLKIYGTGNMLDFTASTQTGGGWEYAPWYTEYREQITDVIIQDSVTNVGNNAFRNMSDLNNLTLSNGTKYLGDYAFYQSSISSVTIPASVETINAYAFADNSNLTTLTFASNSSLREIRERAFANHNISSLVFPKSLETIGDYAFAVPTVDGRNTFGFNLYQYGEFNLKTIGNYAFQNNKIVYLSIPSSVETIGKYAFSQDKPNLTSLNLSGNLTEIQEGAFYNNIIEKLSLPNSLKKIGDYAFYQDYSNSALTSLSFGTDSGKNSTLKEIGNNAFDNNKIQSEDFVLPVSLEKIGDFAFGALGNVWRVSIGPSVKEIGKRFIASINLYEITVDSNNNYFTSDSQFNGIYSKDMSTLYKLADLFNSGDDKLYKIPDSVTLIKSYAIGGAVSYSTSTETPWFEIELPDNITVQNANIETNFSFSYINMFNTSANNQNFKSINGVLYSSDGKILYKIPTQLNFPDSYYGGSDYHVPDGTEVLYENCGYGYLGSGNRIYIPTSVKEIRKKALCTKSNIFDSIYIYSDNIDIDDTALLHYELSLSYPRNIYVKSQSLKNQLDGWAAKHSSELQKYLINLIEE